MKIICSHRSLFIEGLWEQIMDIRKVHGSSKALDQSLEAKDVDWRVATSLGEVSDDCRKHRTRLEWSSLRHFIQFLSIVF